MASVWSSVLALDLTIPSDGPLTPGSGTIYIGGPQLPVELTVSPYDATGAIIFYSSAFDAATVDYYFIAHSDGNGWIRGYTFGGVVHITEIMLGDAITFQPTTLALTSKGLLLIQPKVTNVVTIQGSSTPYAEINTLDTNPKIQAFDSTSGIDEWVSGAPAVQNVRIRNAGGGLLATINAGINVDWRWTIDRVLDFRCTVNCSAAPAGATASTMEFDMPASFPALDTGPVTGQGPTMFGIGAGGGLHNTYNGLIAPGAPAVVSMFIHTNPDGNFFFILSGTTTTAK